MTPVLREIHPFLGGDLALDAWIATLNLGATAATPKIAPPKDYLAVALWPRDANADTHYSFEARLVDCEGEGDCLRVSDGLVALAEAPAELARAMRSREVAERLLAAASPLRIECFLPTPLMARDLDSWTALSGPGKAPIGERHPVTMRSLARLGGLGIDIPGVDEPDAYLVDWRRHWERCAACREALPVEGEPIDCVVCVDAPGAQYSRLLENACVLALGFAPGRADLGRDELDDLLRAGAGIVLWCGADESIATLWERLHAQIATGAAGDGRGACLSALPAALLKLRKDVWHRTRSHTGGYHLLWDDPTRIPRFTGLVPGELPRLTSPF